MGVAWMNSDRFYAKALPVGECLIWQGRGKIGPYGKVGYRGQQWLAHRLSFFFATGGEPEVVMHTCDTPLCVAPAHLKAGTHATNVADKVSKHRHRFAETHPMRKLSLAQVREVRDAVAGGEMQKDVAARMGMSRQQVSRIVRGDRWR